MSVLSKSDVFAASLRSWSWRARFPFWILKARPYQWKPVDDWHWNSWNQWILFFFRKILVLFDFFPQKSRPTRARFCDDFWDLAQSYPCLHRLSTPWGKELAVLTAGCCWNERVWRLKPKMFCHPRVWNLKPFHETLSWCRFSTFVQLISKCLYLYIFLLFFDLYINNHVHWQRCFLKRSHLYFAIHHR